MKGTENLIACRLTGKTPTIVTLHLADGEWPMKRSEAYLQADPDENFERADLRCLVGLRVIVHGPAHRRDAVLNACKWVKAANPESVLGFASDRPTLDPERMVYAEGDFAWLS